MSIWDKIKGAAQETQQQMDDGLTERIGDGDFRNFKEHKDIPKPKDDGKGGK